MSHAWTRFLFDYDTVVPAAVGRPGVRVGVDELAIDDRSRQYPAQVTWATEQKGRGSRGDQAIALFHDEAPLIEELDVGERLMPARIAFVEHAPVPAHGFRVEELFGVHRNQRLAIVAVCGCISEKTFDLRWSTAFVAGTAPDE